MTALFVFSHREELSEQGRLPKELAHELGKVMGATRQAKLELEMADTGVKVGTNAGNMNVPEDGAELEDPEPTPTALIPPGDTEELGSSVLVADEGAFP